ncbi:MAG: amino acid adenylation domain-containing protein [Burkholderiaceae bacterium]|jgi:iturin family lipopeptide synthetase A|nr:amino acid adenylation domain-containing protein [Burkholderiaceae bacterium]MDP4968526.1 amino acid adenylation domain-containing protein [Burkholderiaceae bacterium]
MSENTTSALSPLQKAYAAISKLRKKVDRLEHDARESIAVVGIGCRAPGANNPEELWQLISEGRDAIQKVPAERWNADQYYDPKPGKPGKSYTRHGGFIQGADQFEPDFFNISVREAEGMDPQQRILLEVTWEALENAGIPATALKGTQTGVFVGVTASDYGLLQANNARDDEVNPYFNTGTPLNGCAGRLSYVLGLQGPCMAVDTACSSSLTAIHLACTALRARECDISLAGGVNLTLSPLLYVTLSAAGMMAPDGRCKSFDNAADGYVRGEGCGIVVLKRYSDALAAGDQILGLIRASSVNQDGTSSGFTVPNGAAQQQLIRRTLDKAGIDPKDIDYVEAHGTGTSLGDPIEAESLGIVLGNVPGRLTPLRVGSIKSNIGHLESAAGVMGFIKLLLALKHESLPATLHLTQPNTRIDWTGLNLEPVAQTLAWRRDQRHPRLAAVSAFGASGSNAHLIVEESPHTDHEELSAQIDKQYHLLALSAKTKPALDALCNQIRQYLQSAAGKQISLAELCYNLNTGRSHFAHRLAITTQDKLALTAALADVCQGKFDPAVKISPPAPAKTLRPVFLFTGQGGVFSGMGRDLYLTQPVYKTAIDACETLLESWLSVPLTALLHQTDDDHALLLQRASHAQPALFAVQYALAQLWRSFGIEPTAALGHSIGEYAAACIAGILTLEDAIQLVAQRAKLMETLGNAGGMVAVFSDEQTVRQAIVGYEQTLDIAVLNSSGNTVVAGDKAHLQEALESLRILGIQTVPLSVTHAFHSPLMDPMLEQYQSFAQDIPASAPKLHYVSALNGGPIGKEDKLDGAYWARHCRESVKYALALQSLIERGHTLFIEIGPGNVLSKLGRQANADLTWLNSIESEKNDNANMSASVASAYVHGLSINWTGFEIGNKQTRVALPTYPFQRKRYWINQNELTMTTPFLSHADNPAKQVDTEQRHQVLLTKLCELFSSLLRLDPSEINVNAQLVEMGADSLVLVSGVSVIDDNFGVKLEIRQFFEEITNLDAIARYIAANSTYGLAPTPLVAPQAAPAMQILSAAVQPMSAPTFSGDHLSAMQQLIFAQSQLISQQFAMLSGSTKSPVAMPVPAVAPAPPTTVATSPATSPVEDRSSPLRALNTPINPSAASGMTAQQTAHQNALMERYQQKTAKSKALAQACRPTLADSRASVGFRFSTKEILYPLSGVESTGSRMRDVDGNEYVDLTMGFGVLLFGSRPDHMKGILEEEIKRGFQLGPRTEYMAEISQLFCELTGHERVGFTNSGTEAIMIALRLARAATGRDKIVIFDRAYNGHSDGTLAESFRGPDGELISKPVAAGIPKNVAKDVIVLDYGNPESLVTIRQYAHELAAVLVEPVQSRRLDLQPIEFLRELRALTKALDVALIFDEMVSGFRAHPAGVQGLFNIKADIATYGKIVGGGTPIGAVAGDARYLDGIDGGMWQYGDASYPTAKRTYFGGTFCQHPFSMAACLATLRHLKAEGPALQERLTQRTAAFAQTLNTFFQEEEIALRVVTFASTFGFKFPGNLEVFYYHLLDKGVYIWEWRACFFSTAHTDEDINFVIQAIKETIQEMRDGGFFPPKSGQSKPTLALNTSKAAIATAVTAISSTNVTATTSAINKSAQFGLYFFGNYDAAFSQDKYDLMIQGGRYADQNGFSAIWLPERHFDKFGGFSPNPSLLAAALARETKHIQLRAGSVVMPLHHPLRVAEEWAVVDNLSNGRAGISFASGWHPNDFALAPDNFSNNRALTFEGIDTVRRLWRGESVSFKGGDGKDVSLRVYPQPKQPELSGWLTVVANPETYRKAGEMGLGVLTNLLGQSLEDLEKNLTIYRQALAEAGHPASVGHVAVLMHSYLCENNETAVEQAREPMCNYLLSSLSLFQSMAESLPAHLKDVNRASQEDKDYVVRKAYERYVATRALIGSPEACVPMIQRLVEMGVDEIACFVDFGVSTSLVMENLPNITRLKEMFSAASVSQNKKYPLSEAQQQLYVLSQLSQDGNRAYNDPACVWIEGTPDIAVLKAGLNQIMQRHESLRANVNPDGKTQSISQHDEIIWNDIDLSARKDQHAALQSWLLEQSAKVFNLNEEHLFQAALVKVSHNQHLLFLTGHHIVSDGPSMGTIIGELMSLYDAAKTGEQAKLSTPKQYRDFVQWLASERSNTKMLKHEHYWKKQFSNPPANLELPIDHPRPELKSYQGARLRHTLQNSTLQALKTLASKQGCTLYMLLMAAYTAYIHRLSSQERLVVGTPYTGRGMEGAQSLVGYCVHLLPILSEIDDTTSFQHHLQHIRTTLLDAYTHQDYPFARLIDQLSLKRDISRSPLISTIFNLERLPTPQRVADITVSPYSPPIAFTRVDLTLTANLIGEQVIFDCDYNTDLFEAITIKRLVDNFEFFIQQVITQPEIMLSRLPLLSPASRHQQLIQWNETGAASIPRTLAQVFETVCVEHAEDIAVVEHMIDGQSLTYAQLNARANQLARHLVLLGIQADDRVGVCMPRSLDLMVALLAVTKAGAAYVPMDPNYPAARLHFLQQDAKIKIVLTTSGVQDNLDQTASPLLCVDLEAKALNKLGSDNLSLKTDPSNLAYVIYTSGSTGKPKGAMITHAGLLNYLEWAVQAYEARVGDGSPVLGSIGFDATISSLFVPLVAGNKVVLLPEGEGLQALQALVNTSYKYSFIKLTPAHLEILNTLREQSPDQDLKLAKYLVIGGEALLGSTLTPWFERTATLGINEYGPTETVVGCCTFIAKQPINGIVPIGQPIQGTRLYALNASLEPVPPGVEGELYIGGAGLARGYLDRPDLTAASFVPDPFADLFEAPGARLYRTGDRVRYLHDGTLIFLGRIDSQVKLNGFRIEPGEIETTLIGIPSVREAAVILRQDTPGAARLVAYVTAAAGQSIDVGAIKQSLRQNLPAHMVPSILSVLDEMPLTTHGKIDRVNLPVPAENAYESAQDSAAIFISPGSDVEEQIARVWRTCLMNEKIGLLDNFFDIGGNSLLLLQVFKGIQHLLPKDFALIDLFRFPTIGSLVRHLNTKQSAIISEPSIIADRTNVKKAAAANQASRQRAAAGARPTRRKTA